MSLLASLCATFFILTGCDNVNIDRLIPGQATEADVTRALGRPSARYDAADGSKTLEFLRAPEGYETFFAEIGADGRLKRRIENVLVEANFARIQHGMPQDRVLRVFGTPSVVERYALKPDEIIWTWRFLRHRQDRMIFSAHFGPEGTVITTSEGIDPRTLSGQ